jgi:type IV pilus assembly protein PilQ
MGSLNSNEMLVAGGQPGNIGISGFDKGPFGLNLNTDPPTRYNSGIEIPAGSGNEP